MARAEIRYRAPVTGDLRCQTVVEADAREQFLRDVREQGKGVLQLTVELGDGPDAVLQASYCALARN